MYKLIAVFSVTFILYGCTFINDGIRYRVIPDDPNIYWRYDDMRLKHT